MTITVVRGLVGKPVELTNEAHSRTDPRATPNAAQTAQQAAQSTALNNDAVVMNLRSSRGQIERGEPIVTYSKAKKTSDTVAEKIRETKGGEALEVHAGLNPLTAKSAEA